MSSPLFWAVLIAFFSLVPVVGSALIWAPAAVFLAFSGHWGRAIAVVAICGGGAGVADNIVRPLLLRNRTHLNELLLFLGVLGGLQVFGLLGLVIGPTIVAAAMGDFRVYGEHRDGQGAVDAKQSTQVYWRDDGRVLESPLQMSVTGYKPAAMHPELPPEKL